MFELYDIDASHATTTTLFDVFFLTFNVLMCYFTGCLGILGLEILISLFLPKTSFCRIL